jgi:hypothetical protein
LAIEKSLEQADFILWLEDDWELSVDLQVEPYVKLMQEVPKVGMVSGNPSIRHKRYFRAYDWYPKSNKPNPGECELWHDDHMRKKPDGPQVWWPINLPLGGWGSFGHIGQEQSY